MHNTTTSNVRTGKLPLRTFLYFAIMLFVAVGSTWWFTKNHYENSEATDRAFMRLDSSLNVSSKFLMNACLEDSIYVDLKARSGGYDKIRIMYKPKIDSVMLCARRMHDYLGVVKSSLNFLPESNDNGEDADNIQQSAKWNPIHNEMAENLYDSLNFYSQSLLNILLFKMQFYNVDEPVDTSKLFSKNAKKWSSTYFNELTRSATLSTLTELDYKVWLSANQMTNIIRSQWADHLVINENYFYFLTSLNSSYFLPGQTLEISAGLGAYATNIKPTIFINGQKQVVNAQGYTIYKKEITGGKGGLIPITISYKEPNTGETKTMSKQLGYVVLQTSPR